MKIKTRLHECRDREHLALGTFAAAASPVVVETLVSRIQLDWIAIDLQHSPTGAHESIHLLRALQAVDPMVTPMVRLPNHDRYWVEQSLDAGYTGLIVPMVESEDQARSIVECARYPPRGKRSSVGSARMAFYPRYAEAIDDHLTLWLQIESREGLDRLHRIAEVQGISGLLFGPGDLGKSLGLPSDDLWNNPAYQQAVDQFLQACRSNDLDAAILTAGDGVHHARRLGFNCIGIGSDLYWIRADMSKRFDEVLDALRGKRKR